MQPEVITSAAEYIFTDYSGKLVVITDEGSGMGIEVIDPTSSECHEDLAQVLAAEAPVEWLA